MSEQTYTYSRVIAAQDRRDPTRTTTLRNLFAADSKRRFRELTRVLWESIAMQDAFGLRQQTPSSPLTHQTSAAGSGAFAFPRSADKIAAFMRWLQQQIDAGLLQVGDLQQVGVGIESAWTNKYIFDSYKRGVLRARHELLKAGFDIPTIDDTGGIHISMGTPLHIDRLGLLYTRVFSELKGITAQMEQQIARVLAQGMADGDNPRLLGRKLVSTINGSGMGELGIRDTLGRFIPAQRRAEIMARTEIIRAHAEAQLQEYRNWAVEGVSARVEWMTVGGDRMCNQCADMQGSVYTLDQASGLIPLHASCRCCWIPAFDKSNNLIKGPISGV